MTWRCESGLLPYDETFSLESNVFSQLLFSSFILRMFSFLLVTVNCHDVSICLFVDCKFFVRHWCQNLCGPRYSGSENNIQGQERKRQRRGTTANIGKKRQKHSNTARTLCCLRPKSESCGILTASRKKTGCWEFSDVLFKLEAAKKLKCKGEGL